MSLNLLIACVQADEDNFRKMDNKAAWMDSSAGEPLSPMRLLHPALSAEHGARSVGLTTYPSKLPGLHGSLRC